MNCNLELAKLSRLCPPIEGLRWKYAHVITLLSLEVISQIDCEIVFCQLKGNNFMFSYTVNFIEVVD
jgi:hypothetical protein